MNIPPPTERQARVIWLALTGLSVALLVGLVVALVWGLGQVLSILSPVLWPIAVAGVLAYLLDPVVDFIERKGASRPRAIISVFALALLIVAAFFGSVVPQLINETRQLAARVPAYVARIEKRAEYWSSHPPALVQRLLEWEAGAKDGRSSVTATNASAPIYSTNSPSAAPVEGAKEPSLLGGTVDNESLQKATKWLTEALPKVGYWLFGQVDGSLPGLASWRGWPWCRFTRSISCWRSGAFLHAGRITCPWPIPASRMNWCSSSTLSTTTSSASSAARCWWPFATVFFTGPVS